MKNGYFQLVCSNNGTALKVFLPQEGGTAVGTKEVMEYLNRLGINYDLHMLNKGMLDSLNSKTGEYFFALNADVNMEVRESYNLFVSQDHMQVSARFYPPSAYGERITMQEFLGDLAFKNIKFGIQTETLTQFFQEPQYCTNITVAKGKEPRHGTDAKIEYYFETDLSAKPALNEDGSVDFFHLNTVSHCKKGDVLAKLFPEDPGEYGRSVFDEKVKPRDVKRCILRGDRNTILSEDKQVLTAGVDGHVTLVEDKVFVSDVLEVENVDNSTGNIDYEGSVKINGNVCTNFSVKAKGNIEVSGVVEGAYLEAGGNITIARGMNGMVKGTLKADGNIIAKYIENAKVKAGGYVSTESILHSEVMAGSEIQVTSKKGFITGGRVCATNLIQVKNLGSSMGADTIVEVGADPEIKIELQQLQKQIMEDKKTIDSIHPILTSMAQKLSQGVKFKPEQVKYFQEMLQTENQKKKELEECTQRVQSLQAILDESANARIEVTGEVFAGTRICIADVSMIVKSSMKYCRFTKTQGDVKMSAL